MARELTGKRIVLTGASSGIGLALAKQLAEKKANLLVVSRSEDKLIQAIQTIPAEEPICILAADITEEQDRRRIIQTAIQKWGGLDLLINNAGIACSGHFSTSNEDLLREIMEVNFFAPVELIRLAIPHLTQGQEPAVVNISSMCGRKGIPSWPEYTASKFAFCGMNDALRAEFARFDVDVLLMVPGLTKTDLRKNMLRDDAKMKWDDSHGLPAEAVAKQIIRSIETNKRETVIGSDAKRMLLMHKWFPRLLDLLIARKVRKLYENESNHSLEVLAK